MTLETSRKKRFFLALEIPSLPARLFGLVNEGKRGWDLHEVDTPARVRKGKKKKKK